MRRSLLRSALAVALVGATTLASAAPAFAARPRRQACVGITFAVGATGSQPPGDTVGGAVRDFARDRVLSPVGLGDGIQLMQAGFLPDTVEANVCND